MPLLAGHSGQASSGVPFKPAAAQQLNLSNPLTDGLIFYGLDDGAGTYTNLHAPPAIQYGQIPLTVSNVTQFGTLTRHPGLELTNGYHQPGEGIYRRTNSPYLDVSDASNLTIKGTGEGNTFACGCIRLPGIVGATFMWIFGRTGVSAGEGAVPVTWGFVEGLNYDDALGDYEVGCYVMNGPGPGEYDVHVGTFVFEENTYTSFLCSTVNTSAGHGVASFYAQGSLVASAGVDAWCYPPDSVAETEIMIGGVIHTDTTLFERAFGGYIPWCAMWDRPLSGANAASLHSNPYQLIIPA